MSIDACLVAPDHGGGSEMDNGNLADDVEE
jgi:hypothetical protein